MNIILQSQKNLNENERYLFIENDAFGFGNYSKTYIDVFSTIIINFIRSKL